MSSSPDRSTNRQGRRGQVGKVVGSWAERADPNLIHDNVVDNGGHFAAWEQPDHFTTEVRAAFRALR